MKTLGTVLLPRSYRTSVAPPAVLEDTSRLGNDGVFINTPTWVRQPSGLWAINLVAASNQYITCGAGASFNIRNSITMMSWVNLATIAGYLAIIGKDGLTNHYMMYMSTGRVYVQVVIATASRNITGDTTVVVNTWNFVTSVYDGSFLHVYLNGVSDRAPLAQVGLIDDSLAIAVVLGRRAAGTNLFNGVIWGTRIYNYALTPAQIYSIYQAERSLFGA